MKTKLFTFIAFVLLMASCTKDKEPVVTTYQVFNNCTSYYTSYDPYLNASLYEVVVYCYAGTDIVRQDNYTKIAVGEKTALKEVPETVTKIKISYKVLPPESTYYSDISNNRGYVVAFTLIEPGKNVVAELKDNSMVSASMNIRQRLLNK